MTIAAAVTPTKTLHGANAQLALLPLGGTETYFDMATVDLKDVVETPDITNSADNGWGNVMPGVRRISGTIKFNYDLANKPHLTPYQMKTGSVLQIKIILDEQAANNLLSSDVTTPTQIWFGQAMIGETDFTAGPLAGVLAVTMSFMSKGPWTVPTT